MYTVRLKIFAISTGVSYMRIGQRDELATIRWVSQNLLITRHRSVKNYLTRRITHCAHGYTVEQATIFQGQDGGDRQGFSPFIT